MDIALDRLKGESTNSIVQTLVEHVTKTEEELREEAEDEKKKSTDLKVFLARKDGFELGTIEERLTSLIKDEDTHKYTKKFISDHGFTETHLNDDASLIGIRTPEFNREDHAVLIDGGEYLRALSVERRYWTKRTIEKVIDYLPGLSRLYISADDIQDIVNGLNTITETRVSGFTSKYQSYDDDRRISIQFHGGDVDDIEHVHDEFRAKPTRVEFRQKNSPTDAVSGAITRDARINVPGIRAGSEDLGIETIESVAGRFEEFDQQHYNLPNKPILTETKGGLSVGGFSSVRLEIDEESPGHLLSDGGDEEIEERPFVHQLKKQILDKKQRYDYSEWDSEEYTVLDKERTETFELGIENNDLIINATAGTTPITVKDFCQVILEDFKSTYGISSRSVSLSE